VGRELRQALSIDSWRSLRQPEECQGVIRDAFGPEYVFARWQITREGNRVVVLKDEPLQIEWVLAPAGRFSFGLSDKEWRVVRKLSSEPLLTRAEMQPARSIEVEPFLIMASPLRSEQWQAPDCETIEPNNSLLCSGEQAEQAARDLRSTLPSEAEWEYACRAATESLFWFGDAVPSEDEMPSILGLAEPVSANEFGLCSLFFGEWIGEAWRPSLDPKAQVDPEAGRVVRGGAARFWPWQDDREWSGCVSAFRMPERDTGGAGAAVRLVRRFAG